MMSDILLSPYLYSHSFQLTVELKPVLADYKGVGGAIIAIYSTPPLVATFFMQWHIISYHP